MKDVNVKLLLETEKTNKNLQKVLDQLGKVEEAAKGASKGAAEGFDDAAKSSGKFVNGLKSIGTGLKRIGKLTGLVFIVTEALKILKEVFNQNQAIVDITETAITALSLAFNDLFSFISDNVSTVTGFFKDLFENPKERIIELGNTIKDGLIKRWQQLVESLGIAGKAVKAFFEGDFAEAAELAKEAGREFVDVVTGEEGGLEKVTQFAKEAATSIVNYAKTTVETADKIVKANKQVAFSQTELEKKQLQASIAAERQRQIRDDDTKSVLSRIEANEKLGEILANQLEEEKKIAQQQLDAAILNQKRRKTDEAAVAVLEARNKLLEIQERVEGQASEQLSNKIALERELNDLNETAIEGVNRRSIEQQKFNDELIEGEYARLLAQRITLDQETELERERLQKKIDLYQEGTQARMDAEQELADFEQQKAQEAVEIEKATAQAKLNVASQTFGNLAAIFGENSKAGKAAAIAQTTIDTYAAAQSAYKAMVGIPIVGPALATVAAAAAVAGGIANIKKIQEIGDPVEEKTVSTQTTPAFNVVGAAPENQLAQVLGDQEQKPVKAFVVSSEVSSQQALDRKIETGASLG